MTGNPIQAQMKKGARLTRNPLTDPVVAREWAASARSAGKLDLAGQWEAKARELDGQQLPLRADIDG